jgi:uncharacterized protein (DUF885 family)/dienelactone hydrolase
MTRSHRPSAALLLAAALLATPGAGARAQVAPDSSRAARAAAAVNEIATAYQRRGSDRADAARGDSARAAPEEDEPSNSLAVLARRQRFEDSVLARLRQVDSAALVGRPERIVYDGLRNRLESSVATRVCHYELWGVNSYVNGWQTSQSDAFSQLAVGTPERRERALERARALPRFIDTEIANLREGVRQGYTSPKVIVRAVISQLDDLTRVPADSSPFASPAQRDSAGDAAAAAFRRDFTAVVAREINPAIRRYRDYLASEYLPAAREAIAVSANPDGAACYRASIRSFTTLDLPADSVFELGRREMATIEREMLEIAERDFGTRDVPALLRRLKEDPRYTFRTRQDVIDTAQAAIDRATRAIPQWFGRLPEADVVIQPYPVFRQRAGAPGQLLGARDGRPATFLINSWDPEHKSRADGEATAFHEAIPGHHLQGAIAREHADSASRSRRFGNSGFGEGWALYAERLADEMGLYSSPMTRLGLRSSEAFRAARCLIDAGIHMKGWTREQALDTLMAHTTMSRRIAEGEIDRYISWPGQAPSYMLGRNEILRLRQMARDSLGERFDIREFHDRVLEDGALTLPMLRDKIERWVAERQASTDARVARPVPFSALLRAEVPPADARVAYGPDSLQFGELRVPAGRGPFPVAVVIHGGCWQREYGLNHAAPESEALTRAGIATWTIEYRRIGDPGGGWPGTFTDVARGIDHLVRLAREHPQLDTSRVVLVGHSAGGQLALWAASGGAAPQGRDAPAPPTLPLAGVVSLAGITDLPAYGAQRGSCNDAVHPLMGGTPTEVPARYAAVNPMQRVPPRVPVRLVHGSADPTVPPAQSAAYAERVRAAGGLAEVTMVEGAGPFDVIAPQAPAWEAVVAAVRGLLGDR